MNNGFSSGEDEGGGGLGGLSSSAIAAVAGLSSLGGGFGGGAAPGASPCCLVDEQERCRRVAGNAAYNKRVQKTVAQKRLRLSVDPTARHTFICDYHKSMIQNAKTKQQHQQHQQQQQRRRKDSEDDSNDMDTDAPDVDLNLLQVNTLRRYKKHFKVPTRPGLNKAQLADTMQKHFKTIPVNEKEILAYFVYMVKTNGNKLDQKNGLVPPDSSV